MFYLASTNTVGLLIKSKVFSTEGGVTEVSDSSVWHVWLEDLQCQLLIEAWSKIDLGEKKKIVLSAPSGWFCEKGAIIPGLL